MRWTKLTSLALVVSMIGVAAQAEMIRKESPHTVSETLDRLQAAIEGAGATVFIRIDHAGGAAKIGSELPATEMIMFGNPALGTPAMQDAQTAGLDLPLRALAYADESGQVYLAYRAPSALAEAHGLPTDAAYLGKMAGALEALTNKAVATE